MSKYFNSTFGLLIVLVIITVSGDARGAAAPDKLVGIHSARVMSQSMPWMAQEAGSSRNTISTSIWYSSHLRASSPPRCWAAMRR